VAQPPSADFDELSRVVFDRRSKSDVRLPADHSRGRAAKPDVPFDDLIKSLEWALLHAEGRSVQETRRLAADWLRDVFGNPFYKVIPDITPVVPAVAWLAKTIYDSRSYARMAGLAEALERSGCTDAGLLAHCRGPGPHVLGCWALDQLVGKP
jgi:hypothetical protein